MQTSFLLWIENKDPELARLLEAEWGRRDRKGRVGLIAGSAAAAAAALAGAWWMGGSDAKPTSHAAPLPAQVAKKEASPKPVSTELDWYTGPDKEYIFKYACDPSNNGNTYFRYYGRDGATQEGWIARVQMPASDTQPLRDEDLEARFKRLAHDATDKMKDVKWQIIAKGRKNPYPREAGTVEIVLYAKKPVGER
jgi:hypothetical protein